MIRRPRRTVPATIAGLVLLAASLGLAVSCVQLLAGKPPLIPFSTLGALGRETTWNDPAVLAGGTALAVLGLVLLAGAVIPGTPQVLALASAGASAGPSAGAPAGAPAGRSPAGVTRSSLARDLTARAAGADGITGARVKVGARTVKVVARTPLRNHSGLAERLHDVVAERLDDINLAQRPRLRITVARDRSAR
ncbi:MAG: DUF6286 domain-containing protein [Pseudonocardiaceae bacterium]